MSSDKAYRTLKERYSALEGEMQVMMEFKRRDWVGLTKEDRKAIFSQCENEDRGYIAAMVEAILREKNT
jgi:hypothetical protein